MDWKSDYDDQVEKSEYVIATSGIICEIKAVTPLDGINCEIGSIQMSLLGADPRGNCREQAEQQLSCVYKHMVKW